MKKGFKNFTPYNPQSCGLAPLDMQNITIRTI